MKVCVRDIFIFMRNNLLRAAQYSTVKSRNDYITAVVLTFFTLSMIRKTGVMLGLLYVIHSSCDHFILGAV